MKTSIVDTYEALLQQSLAVPKLVNLASKKDNSFLNELDKWLIQTEKILEKNRFAQCSEIAGLRSKIVASKYDESINVIKKRKHKMSVATDIIYEAQATLLAVLEPIQHRINEATEAIRQLLGVTYQADMIDYDMNFNELLQYLWTSFSTHEQLKGLTSKVLVYVNKSDALRILAEEIDMSRS